MKKILIVDDNKNNRLTLQFILEDWQEDNPDTKLELYFAQDGKEAVSKSEKEIFDLIFMDIMMPEMDGIEATTLIRGGKNKNAMIIACSALSDNEYKNKIITAGAEDYVTKPIDSELFAKRFTNYVGLVKNRKSQPYNVESENVMNNKVFYRKTQFIIRNEVALSEFWEYFLLDSSYAEKEEFSDLIRLLYGLGSYQIKKDYNFSIFLEENDNDIYITMDNIVLLQAPLVEEIVKKNYSKANYKILGNKITFAIEKEPKKNVLKESKSDEVNVPLDLKPTEVKVKKESEVKLQTYDFMERDDIVELEEIAGEMRSLIMLVGSSNINENDIEQLSHFIDKFGTVISLYSQTYAISSALKALANDILENSDRFQEKAADIGALCEAFNRDLTLWIEKLFYEGAPSIDFLDSSIISNANMISSFIKEPQTQEVEVLDDIFDF